MFEHLVISKPRNSLVEVSDPTNIGKHLLLKFFFKFETNIMKFLTTVCILLLTIDFVTPRDFFYYEVSTKIYERYVHLLNYQ